MNSNRRVFDTFPSEKFPGRTVEVIRADTLVEGGQFDMSGHYVFTVTPGALGYLALNISKIAGEPGQEVHARGSNRYRVLGQVYGVDGNKET